MIRSRQDYLAYLEADRIASGKRGTLKDRLLDKVWACQRLLRKLEYQTNCRRNPLLRRITALRYARLARSLGFSIPINVFGPGLSIAHYGTIVVNQGARVGPNCRLHVCVNIGTAAGQESAAPQIGRNCYIGPGAKIYGPIQIGDNVAIGANAVVNNSFPEGNVTLGGIPARVISEKGSGGLLLPGFTGDEPDSAAPIR